MIKTIKFKNGSILLPILQS